MRKLITTAIILIAHCTIAQDFIPTELPDRINITWSNSKPENSQSITWRTSTKVNNSFVEFLEDTGTINYEKPIRLKAEKQLLNNQKYDDAYYYNIELNDLKHDTQYLYRLGNEENGWSEWFYFKTASSTIKPFSFIYVGDAQNDLKSKWSHIIRKAYAKNPEAKFIIHAGDLINRANTDKEWGEWFYSLGFISTTIPTIPTPGNHEYFRDDNKILTLDPHWKAQFSLPENGPSEVKESVYYIDYQNTRIISLDSQRIILDENSRTKQLKWLETVLKNNKQTWTILTLHHPFFSTAKNRDNKVLKDLFKPLLEKYGVDLVLQGHDHTYSRGIDREYSNNLKNIGPVYLLSVSGPKMYKIESEEWMQHKGENLQLFQVIEVDNQKLLFKSYKSNGDLFDSFTIKKDSKGRNRLIQ